mgnify:FL=1
MNTNRQNPIFNSPNRKKNSNNTKAFRPMIYADNKTSNAVDMMNHKQYNVNSGVHNVTSQLMKVPQNYAFNSNNYTHSMVNSPEIYNPNVQYTSNNTPLLLNPNMMGQYYHVPQQNMMSVNQSLPYYHEGNRFVPYVNGQPMIYMGPDGNLYQLVGSNPIAENLMIPQKTERRSPLGQSVISDNYFRANLIKSDKTAMSDNYIIRRDENNQALLNSTSINMLNRQEQRAQSSPLVYNSNDLPKLNFKLPALRKKLSDDAESFLNKNNNNNSIKTKLPSLKELKQKINGTSTDTKKAAFDINKTKSLVNKKTSSRPLKFPCTECDKRFHRQDALQTHMNMHLGLKPYKCDVCEKCFNAKQNMVRHRKRHEK